MNMIQMEHKELKPYRESKVEELKHICPICKNKRELHQFVVDHQHKTKVEVNGIAGAGLIRGVICFKCNSTEGKMLNRFKRSGLNGEIDFITFLREMANYLEQDTTNIIHPTEKPKIKKLMKRPFNKIKKLHDEEYPKRKSLEYPKSGKATVLIKELSERYDIGI